MIVIFFMGTMFSINKHSKEDKNRFAAFELDSDDDFVEKSPWKDMIKMEKKKKKKQKKKMKMKDGASRVESGSPITKYFFLKAFSGGEENREKNIKNVPVNVDNGVDGFSERKFGIPSTSQSGYYIFKPGPHEPNCCNTRLTDGRPVHNNSKVLNKASRRKDSDDSSPHFLSDDDPVRISIVEDSDSDSSSTNFFHGPANIGDPAGDLSEDGIAATYTEPIIVISPESVKYGSKIYCKAQLTFSRSSIKLVASMEPGLNGSSIFEWKTADVVNIETLWIELPKVATVSLQLISKHVGVLDSAEGPGIVELELVVSDPDWSQKQETIKLLDASYEDNWNVGCLDESFEDVIYPEGDPDSICITGRDVLLLRPEKFINDTVVDFYIKYLKNTAKPENKQRFQFFNSFFFRKLHEFYRNRETAFEGMHAFQRIYKWTRKVNIFQKDYIFIPVNFSLHWSLIVICHPGEVINIRDEGLEKPIKVPCILHMDSIRGSHRDLVSNLIRSYLLEEWKERTSHSSDDISLKFMNLPFFPLKLPQQQNSFDCGLFLLHYMELFLKQAPVNFNPYRMPNSTFLQNCWFLPEEASSKRFHVIKLIYEIAKHNPRKASTCNVIPSQNFADVNEDGSDVELLDEARCPNETYREITDRTFDDGPLTPNEYSIVPYSCSSAIAEVKNIGGDVGFVLPDGGTPLAVTPLSHVPYSEEYASDHANGLLLIEGNDRPSAEMFSGNQYNNLLRSREEPQESHWSLLLDFGDSEEDQCLRMARWDSPVTLEMPAKNNNLPKNRLESIAEEQEEICEFFSQSSDRLESRVAEDSEDDLEELDVTVVKNTPHKKRIFTASNGTGDSSAEEIEVTRKKIRHLLDVEEVHVTKRQAPLPKRLTRSLSKNLQEVYCCE